MKQEPFGWVVQYEDDTEFFFDKASAEALGEIWEKDATPLYTEPQYRELSDEDRLAFTKAYFNIHPEAHLSEQFKIKLYELNDFAHAILKKARGNNV